MILTSPTLSRRGMLRLAGMSGMIASLPLGLVAAVAQEATAGVRRFSSLSVDTSGLAERGLSNYAARVAKQAQPILEQVFADRRAAAGSGAPRLILKIDEIQLTGDMGSAAGIGIGQGSDPDYITGAGEVVDSHGRVISLKPIQTSTAAIGGPGPDILYVEKIRTERLIAVLAEWVKQAV